jgi:serine/arginine repetitive matrix protein 2
VHISFSRYSIIIIIRLGEWKQMKAEGRSPPPYNHQASSSSSSVQEKLKRQFSKTDKSSSSNESSMKRSKTQSDACNEEELPPQLKSIKSANEIVVQTSDGLMKFKGISRSFTRKLYEWEKAKGIEPESDSSTFAFLHPKYQVQVDEHENSEHESVMKRALSVDSIKPVPYATQMSHQPSSLSLNDADNLKENVDKKVRQLRVIN